MGSHMKYLPAFLGLSLALSAELAGQTRGSGKTLTPISTVTFPPFELGKVLAPSAYRVYLTNVSTVARETAVLQSQMSEVRVRSVQAIPNGLYEIHFEITWASQPGEVTLYWGQRQPALCALQQDVDFNQVTQSCTAAVAVTAGSLDVRMKPTQGENFEMYRITISQVQ